MPFLLWSDLLSVGVESIDDEHKQLIAIVNDLYQAHCEGHEKEVVGEIIERLRKYIRIHFAREERLMERCDYPGLAEHKLEHTAMEKWVAVMENEYRAGNGAEIAHEILDYLKDWFYDHIGRIDQLYAPYLKNSA